MPSRTLADCRGTVEATTILLLVLAGFVAAFIDSIVGGGGVITLPALLATGMPPHQALGTNKLAATGASLTASSQYILHGVVDRRILAWLPLTFGGSMLGAAVVLRVPGQWIYGLVLTVMAAMTLYVLLRPRFGAEGVEPGRTRLRLAAGGLIALGVGFYDGFLGPGTGSFLLFGLVATQGFGFLRAAGHGRVLNFASNLAALLWFAGAGQVAWAVGLPMVPAMVLGGFLGSRFSIKHGAKWIRFLFVLITAGLMVRLLWGLID